MQTKNRLNVTFICNLYIKIFNKIAYFFANPQNNHTFIKATIKRSKYVIY